MLERGTIDAVFISRRGILRRMQEEHRAKGKKVVYVFCGTKEAPRKVLELAMKKKGIPEDLARSMMSLHEREKTRVKVDSELSEELEVKVWMHQRSVQSPCLFAAMVDVVNEFDRGCAKRVVVCRRLSPEGRDNRWTQE